MRIVTQVAKLGLSGFAALILLCAAAQADGAGKKLNGDSPTDLAPLDTSGTSATDGPMAHANTPPIGGATQGGGGNPKESGPIDAQRSSSKSSQGDRMQPDNK